MPLSSKALKSQNPRGIRKDMLRKALLFVGALLPLGVPGWCQEQLVDQVVAVVNEEPVTQSEVDAYLRPLYEELSKQYEGKELVRQLHQIRLNLLNQIIEDRLVFQEAKAQGIRVDESEIEEEIRLLKKRFPSEQKFEEALAKQGLSLAELRDRYHREASIRRLHDIEIRSRVVVSPQEIDEFYNNRRSELAEEEKLRVRSLTVRKSEEVIQNGMTDEEAKKKIERIVERIQKGESFERLAWRFSEDPHGKTWGEIGWVKRGEMLPAIDEVIFELEKEAVSPVIETANGYHLFKVEEKTGAEIPSLEEARDRIREILFREEAQGRFREWMSDLKTRAYISIR